MVDVSIAIITSKTTERRIGRRDQFDVWSYLAAEVGLDHLSGSVVLVAEGDSA